MKKITFLFMLTVGLFTITVGQTTIVNQGFETDQSGYSHVPSQTPATDPGDQYFYRAEPSDPAIYEGSVGPYTNVTGSWLFVGSNPNTINGGSPGVLTLDPITVTGYTNLEFHADFGACDNDWDTSDELKVEYNFDGGSWTTLYYFVSGATNDPLVLTGNASGGINTANGTVLTYALATISSDNFTGSGTTLNIRIVQDAGANYEAFGVDNIEIKGLEAGGVNNPTNFAAVTVDVDQIDLSWIQNGNSDDVMVAWSSAGVFGTPSGTYAVDDPISGGGTVIYNGSGTSTSHTSLTADTRYYYKAWSVDATPAYSSGVTADTTTLAAEPTADAASFSAAADSPSEITVSWLEPTRDASSYLIKGSNISYADITDPVDGSTETNGTLIQNVNAGDGSFQFSGLAPSTAYYFQIYPYNGDNGSVNYKIDSPAQSTETTDAANTDLLISEVADPDDFYQGRFVELYNTSASTIDFSVDAWYLVKQTGQVGGGGSTSEIQLTGSIVSGGTYTIANNATNFNTYYSFSPDLVSSSVINGNGDDAYYLYYGGGYGVGTLVDAYGEDEDGTGLDWEYLDSKAIRLRSVSTPNTTWTASEWDIPGSAGTLEMTPGAHAEDVSWQATATGSDWNIKSTDNWGGTYGYIPDASFNVTILDAGANSPVINGQAACNDLTLSSSSVLALNPGAPTNIYGDLTIASSKSRYAATFILLSNSTDNASLIINGSITGGADAWFQRDFEGYNEGAVNGWHLISSPVNTMAIDGTQFDTEGTLNDLYQWDESTSTWLNYKQGHFSNFDNGFGYLCAFQNTDKRTFIGTFNNSNVPISGLSLSVDGWHVLGNPFPSAIEWNTTAWGVTGIAGTAKVWDEDGGNYIDVVAGNIIPSTNGFFVQVSNTTNSLTIPASARVHDDTDNYKNGTRNTEDETLILKATSDENSYYDINRVGFKANATESWDTDFDSHKLFGNEKAPQLWTVSNEENFSLNYLPYTSETYPINLNFRAGVNGTYHINADGLNSFSLGTDIFLEDLLMDKIIDLNEQSMYTFTATTDDDEARFILHFYGITSTGDTPASSDAKIYAYQNTVYVQLNDQTTSVYHVEVINIVGQQIYYNEFVSGGMNSFKLNEKPGVYFVRLRAENKTMVQKVMISK